MRRVMQWTWVRLFEAAVIAGGLSAAVMLGVATGWVSDRGPIYLENPDASTSFVSPNVIRPGDFIITSRSVRRMDTCAVNSGIWIVTAAGDLLYPIASTQAIARPDAGYRSARIAYQSPPGLAPGAYAIRSYPVCDRNPLSQVQQQLRDLPFVVVAP